jgi:hypothetical protein
MVLAAVGATCGAATSYCQLELGTRMALGGVQLVHYQTNLLQVNYNRDTWSLCPAATELQAYIALQCSECCCSLSKVTECCFTPRVGLPLVGVTTPRRGRSKLLLLGVVLDFAAAAFFAFFFEFVGGVEVALPPARSAPSPHIWVS